MSSFSPSLGVMRNEVNQILTLMLDHPEWHKAQNMAFYSPGWCVCVVGVGRRRGLHFSSVNMSYQLHALSGPLAPQQQNRDDKMQPLGYDRQLGGSRKPPAQRWYNVCSHPQLCIWAWENNWLPAFPQYCSWVRAKIASVHQVVSVLQALD